VKVSGAATTFCLKIRLYNVLSNVTYAPSHRQAGAVVTNILSTFRTATDLCTIVLLPFLFGSNGNSYTVRTQRDVCIRLHILHHIEMLVGNRNTNIGTAVNTACNRSIPACQRFARPGLGCCCMNIRQLVQKLLQVA
jgi:hypothetical protein